MLLVSKKYQLLILAGFVVYSISIAEIARLIFDGGFQPNPVSSGILKALEMGFIILSIIAFIWPWLIYKGVIPFKPKQRFPFSQISPEKAILIIGYFFLISPVIYGLLLFFLGMSLHTLYYFVGASVIGISIWGFLNYVGLRD